MAIYHLSMSVISRKAKRSSTGAAAYRSASLIVDRRTGEEHDYTKKRGVVSATIHTPADAPEWARDRVELWNRVEAKNKREDAQTAREIVVAIPDELSAKQRAALVAEFAQEIADRYSIAVDACIHKPSRKGDNRNHHAHLLTTTNRLGPNGLGNKVRELDNIARAKGHQVNEVEHIRVRWAEVVNSHLARAGSEARIDHRTLKEQGIDRAPETHLGPGAVGFERRTGEKSRRREWAEERAGELEAERQELADLRAQLDQVKDAQGELDVEELVINLDEETEHQAELARQAEAQRQAQEAAHQAEQRRQAKAREAELARMEAEARRQAEAAEAQAKAERRQWIVDMVARQSEQLRREREGAEQRRQAEEAERRRLAEPSALERWQQAERREASHLALRPADPPELVQARQRAERAEQAAARAAGALATIQATHAERGALGRWMNKGELEEAAQLAEQAIRTRDSARAAAQRAEDSWRADPSRTSWAEEYRRLEIELREVRLAVGRQPDTGIITDNDQWQAALAEDAQRRQPEAQIATPKPVQVHQLQEEEEDAPKPKGMGM